METNVLPLEDQRTNLCGFDEDVTEGVKALLFGVLVKLAAPVVEHYISDLYHDAQWIERLVGPITFFYSFNAWGTCLGDSLDDPFVQSRSENIYRVTLDVERGMWFAVTRRIES